MLKIVLGFVSSLKEQKPITSFGRVMLRCKLNVTSPLLFIVSAELLFQNISIGLCLDESLYDII